MPDYPAPVAAGIIPPNPQQGLNTFSNILGIRQREQQLQTGQYIQQTAQAESQMAQQKSQQLSSLQNLFKTAMGPNSPYDDGKGNLDTNKLRNDAYAIAGTYGGPQIDQSISSVKNVYETRRTFQSLGKETNASISDVAKGIGTKQGDITPEDNDLAIERMRTQVGNNPDAQYQIGALRGYISAAKDQNDLRQRWQNASSMIGGFSQNAPYAQNAGGVIAMGAANTFTGAPAGAGGITTGPAPQFVTPPGGVPVAVGGGGGQTFTTQGNQSPRIAGGVGSGNNKKNLSGFPGPQPTDQEMASFGAYQQNLNKRVAVASNSLPRIEALEQALGADMGGGGTSVRARIAQRAQALGMPKSAVDAIAGGNLAGIQEAEKYLFQTTLSGLEQSMAGDPHVAQFQAANSVFPNVNTDPRARENVLGFLRDQGQRDYAEQQALSTARRNGTFNPVTWQADWQKQLREGAPGVPETQRPEKASTLQRVSSPDEARKLPKGTHFLTPDGREKIAG